MTTQMTTIQFSHITNEINSGRPFWALMRLNEWSEGGDHLRTALSRRCVEALRGESYAGVRDIITLLDRGARMADLSEDQQLRARAVTERACAKREVPTIAPFRTRFERRVARRESGMRVAR